MMTDKRFEELQNLPFWDLDGEEIESAFSECIAEIDELRKILKDKTNETR